MAKAKNLVPTEAVLSVAKLVVDTDLNVRLRQGTNVRGVVVKQDGYDLSTMIAQIFERGKILEPIHVSCRKSGDKTEYVVLRGNRRTLAGQMILQKPETPQELVKELNATRVLVFHNLTPEQEREHIMDQNSKPFSRVEMIRHAWNLREQGQSFERIAVDNFEMWGQFGRDSRTLKALASVRAIPAEDIDGRRKAIKKWLRGTVDEYVLPAFDLGPIVQAATIRSEMLMDGQEPDQNPKWKTTVRTQERMAALGEAKAKDGTKWNPHLGGENFNALIEKFAEEDFPKNAGDPKPKEKKRPSIADLKVRANAAKSSPARMAFNIAAGLEEAEFKDRDDSLSLLEAKDTLFRQLAEEIDPDAEVNLRDFCTLVFLRDNVLDFKGLLEQHKTTVNAPSQAIKEENKGSVTPPDDSDDDSDDDDSEVEGSDTEGEASESQEVPANADGTFKLPS